MSKISAKITINEGVKRKLGDTAKTRMLEAVNELRNETLITLSGNRSGRTYKVPGTQRTYTASSPGQPPAQATSGLRQSIKGSIVSGVGRVSTSLEYGVMLQYGTKNMAPRPWLSVAADKARDKIRQIFSRKWL